MKIIHLSDTHIYTNKIHGIDPAERLRKALKHILLEIKISIIILRNYFIEDMNMPVCIKFLFINIKRHYPR